MARSQIAPATVKAGSQNLPEVALSPHINDRNLIIIFSRYNGLLPLEVRGLKNS